MKQLASNYSISGAAVTLSGVNVPLSQILLVSNATTGNVLYSMAGPSAAGYTQAASSVITLANVPSASDKLTIFYDDGVASANAPASVAVSNFPASQVVSGSVSVSNFPATQPVSGTVTANTGLAQPLTDSQLRATAVPVSGTVTVSNPQTSVSVSNFPATQPVSGTVGISGTVPVSGPLTDTQLRATAVPISGTVTANTGLTQPLTDTQLRASAVPVSATSLPLPSGAATAANQATEITSLANIDADLGAPADAAATTDTGTFSLIALVKRLLGKIPTLVAGRFPVDGSGVTQPVSGTFWQATQPVSIASLPALATGSNTIGAISNTSFGVSSLPSLPAGTNSIGTVINGAGTANIGSTPPVIAALTAYNGTLSANTSTQIIAGSTLSRYLFIQNTSGAVIYLAFGAAATTANGIQIPASGGSMVFESNFLTNQSVNLLSVPGGTYVAWGA